jgi:enoyl-[acyl-carrier-protein] reductase (NADH)
MQLLTGKKALIFGIANKYSIAGLQDFMEY